MGREFSSRGKLLLTSEYVVLDGAKAIAFPTQKGQIMKLNSSEGNGVISWFSYDISNTLWYKGLFKIANNHFYSESLDLQSQMLVQIFEAIRSLNIESFSSNKNYQFSTFLEFPRNWGWGSSSTLIQNLANCFKVNPYALLSKSFGGSGYDIACASAIGPITYQLNGETPIINDCEFNPSFSEDLFFVYLGSKQDSREGIARYRKSNISSNELNFFTDLSNKIIANQGCKETFCDLLNEHEERVSMIIGLPPLNKGKFKDYPNTLKSLGAWGGDFALAVGKEAQDYFPSLGLDTVLKWKEVINYP